MNETATKQKITKKYQYLGKIRKQEVIPNGHINDTLLLTMEESSGKEIRIILQRINTNVFKNPVGLMENVEKVTSFLRKKIELRGGDPMRETLWVLPTEDGKNYAVDEEGHYWRAYYFVEGTETYNQVTDPKLFYESGVAFGQFQKELDDFPAEELCETIPKFHDTVSRLEVFRQAVAEDVCGRAVFVQKEIQEYLQRESLASCYQKDFEEGRVPLRVTHNDTKLNNVMIDVETGKGICVIDLDTVMPGFVMNDFGDAIRYGANTAAEDETDLAKVCLDLSMYEAFAKGFMESVWETLTEAEIALLPKGAMLMTYECGLRFLTDYLQGDVYFKTEHERHNLDRSRNQLKLLQEMERAEEAMLEIVWKERKDGWHVTD